jgi:hypothetical protein
MRRLTVYTTSTPHGFEPGSLVRMPPEPTLRQLLTRPRLKIARATTATTLEVHEVRMTWQQWRHELLAFALDWLSRRLRRR